MPMQTSTAVTHGDLTTAFCALTARGTPRTVVVSPNVRSIPFSGVEIPAGGSLLNGDPPAFMLRAVGNETMLKMYSLYTVDASVSKNRSSRLQLNQRLQNRLFPD